MKIIMLTTDYLPNIGGLAAHVHHLSRALIQLGHQVIVVNPTNDSRGNSGLEQDYIDGVPVVRSWYSTSPTLVGRVWARTHAALRGVQSAFARLEGVDVIHQHDHMGSTLAAIIASIRHRWIWTNHTSTFLRDVKRTTKRNLIRHLYQRTERVIAVSREIEEVSGQLFGKRRVVYIPNGVDTSRFCPKVRVARSNYGISEEDKVVLCPRRMVKKNGVVYLAEAVRLVIEAEPGVSWRFIFLGNEAAGNTDSEYIAQVQSRLRETGVWERVKFLGNVPASSMPEVYALADIVVIPSLVEAVSLSALEAMAMEKPVVATSVGGLRELIENRRTGISVRPESPDALAAAILELHRNSRLASYISKSACDLVRREYTWERVAERTLAVYAKAGF